MEGQVADAVESGWTPGELKIESCAQKVCGGKS